MTDNTAVESFLAHHGVLGMKWGVRKREETSPRNSSAATSTSNGKNLGSTKVSELRTSKNKKGLTDTQKKVLIGAAIVAGVLVGSVLAYKGLDALGENNAAKKRIAESILQYGSAFKKDASLSGTKSIDEIMTQITPRINPNYRKSTGYRINCRRATFAYEMNRRGYDVQATKGFWAWGQDNIGLQNAVSKPGKEHINPLQAINMATRRGRSTANINPFGSTLKPEKALDKAGIFSIFDSKPDGARGEMVMNVIKKEKERATKVYGHSLSWEKINGKTWIIDNQTNHHWAATDDGISKLFSGWGDPTDVSITRLDDQALNLGFLSRWVENR